MGAFRLKEENQRAGLALSAGHPVKSGGHFLKKQDALTSSPMRPTGTGLWLVTVTCAVKTRVPTAIKSGHNAAMTLDSFDSAIPRGIYRHYKNKLYRVFGTVTHSESEEDLVLYAPLGQTAGAARLWVRPLGMFTETVMTESGPVPRFAFVEGFPDVTDESQ